MVPLVRNRHFFLIELVPLPAVVLAFVLRPGALGLEVHRPTILLFIMVAVPVALLVAYGLGFYRSYGRYAGLVRLDVRSFALLPLGFDGCPDTRLRESGVADVMP